MAIIGGLAVTCRCRSMARATADVDAVTGPDGAAGIVSDLGAEQLAEVLEQRSSTSLHTTVEVEGGPVTIAVQGGHLFVNEVKVDVIATDELALLDLDGLNDKQRLFVASHRWALESAEPVLLRVAHRSAPRDLTIVHAKVAVATPAALVAMKLHSLQDRRQARSEKEASDTEDLYRLLQEHDAAGLVADAIVGAPYGLTRLVVDAARRLLVEESLARLRSLRKNGGPSAASVGDEEFRLVTTEFVNGLLRD